MEVFKSFLVVFFGMALSANTFAYMDTAKLVGSNENSDFYIYTGSIKKVPGGQSGDYWGTSIINFKSELKDGTKSTFRNMTYHCGETDRKAVTVHIDVGHAELWGNGAKTYETSKYVGKKLALTPGAPPAATFDYVCGGAQASSVAKEPVSSMEQEYQQSLRNKELERQRQRDRQIADEAAANRRFDAAIKYSCPDYSYVFWKGKAYEAYHDWDFSEIKSHALYDNSIISRSTNYKYDGGVFKFTTFQGKSYNELHVKSGILYQKYSDGINKSSCTLKGGDFNSFE